MAGYQLIWGILILEDRKIHIRDNYPFLSPFATKKDVMDVG